MNRKNRRAEAARQRHAKAMVGMEMRYGGRTLVVTAYVNTDEDPNDVYRRVELAARGPKRAMVVVSVAVQEPCSIWEGRGPTLFNGRTLIVTCYINTDEPLDHALTRRVMNAANKPGNPKTAAECSGQLAVVVGGGELPLDEARKLWLHVVKKADAQKDGPN